MICSGNAATAAPPHTDGTSKLANLLFTCELQRRLTGTTTISVAAHPGAAKNDLIRNTSGLLKLALLPGVPIQQEPAMGALTTLRAATDPGVRGGQYFGPGGPVADARIPQGRGVE
jgi:NAD(P)-dependent dehydrogenase (short-subunit alcohol dehydrogenase family)